MYLVPTCDYDVAGINYYYAKREQYGISLSELAEAGATNGDAWVDSVLTGPLWRADQALRSHGWSLLVKDGYRSPALYRLIRHKLAEARSEAEAAKLINMAAMPHANGRAVDIALVDLRTGNEVDLFDRRDDNFDRYLVGYYQDVTHDQGREYHRRQTILRNAMFAQGFVYGSKLEVWHFELPSIRPSNVQS